MRISTKGRRILVGCHILIREDLLERLKKTPFYKLLNELLENFLDLWEFTRRQRIVAPRGFEPRSPAPKAGRIDRYPTGLYLNN